MLTAVLCPALGATIRLEDSKQGRYTLEEHLLESHQLLHCCDDGAHYVGNVDLDNLLAIP